MTRNYIVESMGFAKKKIEDLSRLSPPKLQSSFAKASEDTRIPPRPGGRGFLRRRVKDLETRLFEHRGAAEQAVGP